MKLNKKKLNTYWNAVKQFFKTDLGIALAIVLTWQFIITIFGYTIDMTTVSWLGNGGRTSPPGLLGHTFHWDAGWYATVIEHFYIGGSPAAPAFYPLFPGLVKIVHLIFFGQISLVLAAFIVNTAATWLGITALVKIIRSFTKKPQTPWIIVGLFLASPAAMFLHMFYGEAVFIALGFWAYWFALQKKWALSAIVLTFALLARLPAVTFILLCGLEFLRTYNWNIWKAIKSWKWLWFLLTPLSLLGYGIYLYFARGDFLAMAHAYHATDDWAYYSFDPNIIGTIGHLVKALYLNYLNKALDPSQLVNIALPLLAMFILLATSIYALVGMKKKGIPLAIFGFFSFIMFSINGHIVSAHRYVLPCIVVFVVTAILIEKYKLASYLIYPILFTCTLIQSLLIFFYINSYFAG